MLGVLRATSPQARPAPALAAASEVPTGLSLWEKCPRHVVCEVAVLEGTGKRRYSTELRQEQAALTRQRILAAARRLLLGGSYGAVRMEDIAAEAGVAYQTVYAVFGNKLRLAHAIIAEGWPHVAEALKLLDEARASSDPRRWLRTAATITRRISEPCADLVRFMRESGDADLLARYRWSEDERRKSLEELVQMLDGSGRLRPGTTGAEALAVIWSMTGSDFYSQMVFQCGWSPDHFERWLGDAFIELLLEPAAAA